MNGAGRLVVVSNRLPVTIESTEDGPQLRPSGGGLVSALIPILRQSGGCWVGWTGTDYDDSLSKLVKNWCSAQNYSFGSVFLTASERAGYYRGFSNEIIWPLFHGLPSRCQFGSAYWNTYCKVNEKFAETIRAVSQNGDLVWVHDYHLMMIAQALRARGMQHRLAYFHHIPFPPPDIFETLPWRVQVLRALTHFNVVGFQTARDRRNFIACLRRCLSDVRVCRIGENFLVRAHGQSVSIGAYPISIDYEGILAEASHSAVLAAAEMIQSGLSGTRMILGVDRLDYTKGIPERLIAFQTLLERKPDLRGHVTMVQIVVPSREDIPEYKQLKLRIEMLVSKINGEYSRPGWVPIHYFYRCVPRSELMAFYRAAHVALVTPLKDGMNLVAKEFCASRVDKRGVLVLSEFAGAAQELKCGALLVNPYDAERVVSVLELALRMEESEQCFRMESLQARIRAHDVFDWSRSFAEENPLGFAALRPEPVHWTTESIAAATRR